MQAGDKTAAELEAELMKLEQMKHTELRAYWSVFRLAKLTPFSGR